LHAVTSVYFRKKATLEERAAIDATLSTVHDDGLAVWGNGTLDGTSRRRHLGEALIVPVSMSR
jgi:hypothetical protein